MSTKENYQEKLEAEVELALATLTKLRAQARNSKADARIKYSEQIDKLEKEVVAVRSKIKEMAEAGEDSWQTLKDGWSALSSAVQDTVAKLKD
jgi:phage host-nuclease inhibitor protein Gam